MSRRRILGSLAVVAGAIAVWAGPASASPTAKVTPDSGLADGQAVTVSFAGFESGQKLSVLQCANPPSAENCDVARAKFDVVATNGSGSTTFNVHTGTIGAGRCDAQNPCVIVVNQKRSAAIGDNGWMNVSFAGDGAGTGAVISGSPSGGAADPTPVLTAVANSLSGAAQARGLAVTGQSQGALLVAIGLTCMAIGSVLLRLTRLAAARR